MRLYVLLLTSYVFLSDVRCLSTINASVIEASPETKLDPSAALNQETFPPENTKLLMKDVQSRLNIMESTINQLKKENSHRDEEIRQMKNQEQIFLEMTRTLMDRIKILESKTNTEDPNEYRAKVKRQADIKNSSFASWAKLEISDHVIGYMDYDTCTIKIYDHASNRDINIKNEEKKYYFEPIGQLDHFSAKSAFNNISNKAEMIFHVNMWSDSIRNAVHKFISDDLKRGPVNINLVRVLPMDRVMIFNEMGLPPNFELEQNWINYKSDKYLKFKYICDQLKKCNHLAAQMKTNPEQFQLKMRFSLSSQESQTKETKISIENIMHGEMMNELDQKFKGKEVILLTAAGKKQLLKESSENVIIQTVDDNQVASKDSQVEIYRRLENMIQFGRTIIKKGDEKAWENNVFWNHDNYRPDLSTKILNDVYKKLDTEKQEKLASSFSNTNKGAYEISGSFLDIFSGSAKATADFSREGFDTKETIEKFLSEARDRVEWDGVKFIPKEMELYSINMARLKNTQAFKDTNVKISYTTSMLTIDVRQDSSFDSNTSSELFELKLEVAGLTDKLNEEIKELEHVKRKGDSSLEPPSSCQELSDVGHYLNGFYVVTNKQTKKIQTIYCRFGSSVFQKFIGQIDVKTKSVHFYVQRNSSFSTNNAVIPFDLVRLNEGGAMNLALGIFTAPVPGIYHFEFSGQKDTIADFGIHLQVNGANIGLVYTYHYQPGLKGWDNLSFSVSLRLKTNDRVNLYQSGIGTLYDRAGDDFTHFSGWLVEEDLMQ